MGKIIEIVIMEGVALLMFWFAYAIGIKRNMMLIAGYNRQSARHVTDKAGLAKLIARLCLLVGVAAAVMPIATSLWGATPEGFYTCMGAFGGFLLGVVGLTLLQAREYVDHHRQDGTH